jgi:hypothetical protein
MAVDTEGFWDVLTQQVVVGVGNNRQGQLERKILEKMSNVRLLDFVQRKYENNQPTDSAVKKQDGFP